MRKQLIAGFLFSSLMLTSLQQAQADQASTGAPAAPKDQMGMAPKCDNQRAWNFNADFLYWSTNFNSLSGLEAEVTSSDEYNATIELERPDAEWDPGVRLALGWNTGYDNWDIQGMWTYFYNSTTGHETPIKIEYLGQDVGFDGGHTKFSFRYNAADFELGKSFYVSRHFFIRPFTGVHAIWTTVRNFLELDSDADDLVGDVDVEGSIRQSAWGVGPRIGVNTNWGDFRGFSLIGNVSGSLVYGKHLGKGSFDVEVDETEVDVNIRGEEYWQLMPTMQLQMGLSYGCCFGKDKNQFRVNAMWEANFISEAANGPGTDKAISMQGLTLDFGFIF
ncbi:MAG: hypothetical protein JSS60_02215 [Verrucomicrobia bacterium]|nr:hypothetical protein [Verrucomicrobiota bacterium]